jgi:hypothetical protein
MGSKSVFHRLINALKLISFNCTKIAPGVYYIGLDNQYIFEIKGTSEGHANIEDLFQHYSVYIYKKNKINQVVDEMYRKCLYKNKVGILMALAYRKNQNQNSPLAKFPKEILLYILKYIPYISYYGYAYFKTSTGT